MIFKKYEDGGLKMVNLMSFIASLKLFWIRHLIFSSREVGLFIPNFNLHKFITCGIEYITTFLKTLHNKFWMDVFKSYITLYNVIVDSNVAAESPLYSYWWKTFFQ